MIQLMDRNRNGKLDKREFNFDIDSLTSQPGFEVAKTYVPDLDKLIKKVSEHIIESSRVDFNFYGISFAVRS